MHRYRCLCGIFCAVVLVWQHLRQAPPAVAAEAAARAAAANAITAADTKRHVDALADDTFEGREAGSRGNRAAAGYIIEHCKKLGIPGGGPKGSYFQPFGNYRNLLALAEGSDPELKKQVVVISAHYDHVGYGTNRNSYGPIGRIHNGADDNASGVAGLMEVMDAVAQLPERPKRSILFAFWDGEEKGLLGSQHWVEHPTVELSRVPIMLNVDMIGRLRNGKVEVFGIRTSPGLRRLLSQLNDSELLQMDFDWDIRADSDHHPFFARNVPFLMLHTGKHSEYHRPSDDAELINNDGLSDVSRLMFHVLVELADAPQLGPFRAASRGESRNLQRSRERPWALPPGRLGVRWDDELAKKSGQIVVTAVTPGSAAALAGVRAGDRFVKFAGQDVNGGDAFRLAVLAAESPAQAVLERAGSETPIDVKIELVGKPARLGIAWRTDDAEPATVIVSRVIPGSAGDLAGVRVGDRIYRIGGQEFADAEAFRQIAVDARGILPLEIERAGRVQTVEVKLVPAAPAAAGQADAPPTTEQP
ncbi:MAG: M20/M25/M40 family metallo-hydrolase [Pirellulales bacterium]